MPTKVVHCKREPYDVYIGRGSKWGNPFRIGPDGTREEVIQKYHANLIFRLSYDEENVIKELAELKDKVLGCWCAPKACHGDVIARFVDWAADKLENQET